MRARKILAASLAAGAALALAAACSSSGGASTGGAGGSSSAGTKQVSIAVLVAGASNAYQAAGVAAIKAAAPGLDAKVDVFDANFDASKQYSQFQTAITSKKYQGIIIDPADGSGIVSLVAQANAAHIPVAAWNQPIGTDYSTPNPTVKGVVAQAMLPINDSGEINGQLTKQACAASQGRSAVR